MKKRHFISTSKRTAGKRILSWMLAGFMLIGSIPADSFSVLASDALQYESSAEEDVDYSALAPASEGDDSAESYADEWTDSSGGEETSYEEEEDYGDFLALDSQEEDSWQEDEAEDDGWEDEAEDTGWEDADDSAFLPASGEDADAGQDDSLLFSNSDDAEEDSSGSLILSGSEEEDSQEDSDDSQQEEEPAEGEEADQPQGETVALVSASGVSRTYDNFSAAWDAAVSAAAESGSAVLDLAADWVSDENGCFGTGYNFSNEGSILMDVPDGTITIRGNGYKILGKGEAKPGRCNIGLFSGTLVIENAVIAGGSSTTDGGGILVLGGNVSLDHVTLTGNQAGAGGGLCITGGSAAVKDCVITDNSAETMGGGIFADTGNASLTLAGTVQVFANDSEVEGDVYLGGSGSIFMEELGTDSYLTVAGFESEGERFLGTLPEDASGCVVSADEDHQILWENGNVFLIASQEEEVQEEEVQEEEAAEEEGEEALQFGSDAGEEETPDSGEEAGEEEDAAEYPEEEEAAEELPEEAGPEEGEGEPEALEEEAAEENPEEEQNGMPLKAWTVGSSVNMRAEASTDSEVVTTIEEAGTELLALDAVTVGEEVWIHVQWGEFEGYIRADLLELEEPESEAEESLEDETEETGEAETEETTAEETTAGETTAEETTAEETTPEELTETLESEEEKEEKKEAMLSQPPLLGASGGEEATPDDIVSFFETELVPYSGNDHVYISYFTDTNDAKHPQWISSQPVGTEMIQSKYQDQPSETDILLFDVFFPYAYQHKFNSNTYTFYPSNSTDGGLDIVIGGAQSGGYADSCGVRDREPFSSNQFYYYYFRDADVSGFDGYDSYFAFLKGEGSGSSFFRQTCYRGNLYFAPPLASVEVSEGSGAVTTEVPVTSATTTNKTIEVPVARSTYEANGSLQLQIGLDFDAALYSERHNAYFAAAVADAGSKSASFTYPNEDSIYDIPVNSSEEDKQLQIYIIPADTKNAEIRNKAILIDTWTLHFVETAVVEGDTTGRILEFDPNTVNNPGIPQLRYMTDFTIYMTRPISDNIRVPYWTAKNPYKTENIANPYYNYLGRPGEYEAGQPERTYIIGMDIFIPYKYADILANDSPNTDISATCEFKSYGIGDPFTSIISSENNGAFHSRSGSANFQWNDVTDDFRFYRILPPAGDEEYCDDFQISYL